MITGRKHRESMWRRPAREVIERVLSEFRRREEDEPGFQFGSIAEREKAIRAALDDAFPWGDPDPLAVKKQTVRRVWLDEVKRVRGLKPPLWTPKSAIADIRKLIAHETRYGTKESRARVIASLPWLPKDLQR